MPLFFSAATDFSGEVSPSHAAAVFAQRFALWQSLHLSDGPARSYGYAWRLPQLAKSLGGERLAHAGLALARDLFTLGRFAEAAQALPDGDALPEIVTLRHTLAWLREENTPLPNSPGLAYLADCPEAVASFSLPAASEAERHLLTLCQNWARQRRGEAGCLHTNHRALARLRQLAPTWAAQGAAIHAESLFWQAPRWADVWLDEALAQIERYGQHHLKVRMLGLKARALAAAGALREAQRFHALACAWGQRQQAHRYVRLFTEASLQPR